MLLFSSPSWASSSSLSNRTSSQAIKGYLQAQVGYPSWAIFPILRPYPQFREWAQKYGTIFSLKLGPQMIVLNTARAANKLFYERSKIYSSRAPPHAAHDILSAPQQLVFLPYDTEWKTARKTLISAIGPQTSKALRAVQELESRIVTKIDGRLTCDARPQASSRPPPKALHKTLANFAHAGQPGNYLYGPIPNTSYVNTYLRTRSDDHPLSVPGIGQTPDGFLREKLLAYTAGMILEAGSDTTASTMQMLARVRTEIDAAVGDVNGGDGRMPEFEDEEKCPYFVARIKKTLRRRPPTIMGINNVWAIHMDPAVYPHPRAYQPERFPTDPCKKMIWGSGPESRNRDHYVFSWGRRFCPGYHIAEASFFIVLPRLIWALGLTTPIDPATGRVKVPDINDEEATYTSGFASVPRIFPVSFKPKYLGGAGSRERPEGRIETKLPRIDYRGATYTPSCLANVHAQDPFRAHFRSEKPLLQIDIFEAAFKQDINITEAAAREYSQAALKVMPGIYEASGDLPIDLPLQYWGWRLTYLGLGVGFMVASLFDTKFGHEMYKKLAEKNGN
ncbi:cytochrome P450 [Phlegmacium glaucopus]|nr:cytochrome P450 [Phlegmacium glaucopus]